MLNAGNHEFLVRLTERIISRKSKNNGNAKQNGIVRRKRLIGWAKQRKAMTPRTNEKRSCERQQIASIAHILLDM